MNRNRSELAGPPQSTPLVSAILPIYNAEPYLDQALTSVQSQTLDNIEIICLNDGSTDNSLSTMRQHAAKDNRIRIIDKQNQGYGASCNRGIDEALGKYIAIVEPDDWIEGGMFKDMVDFATKFEEQIDIVKTPYWRIWLPDTPNQKKLNCDYKSRIRPSKQPFTIDDKGTVRLLRHHPSIWSALYRREFLNTNSIRMNEYPGAGWADNPFFIETLCQAATIVYLDKAYYCYREDTPEQLASFVQRNTLLPIERWNDMTDILKRLNIENADIWQAHNSRGFSYLNDIVDEVDLGNQELKDAATQMFQRMDEDLVMSDSGISPCNKELFLKLRNLPERKIPKGPYLRELVRQGLFDVKNIGLSQTAHMAKSYFERNDKHTD